MEAYLTYSGSPGNISATLHLGTELIDGGKIVRTTGLRNKRAVARWAKGEAELYKQEQAAPEYASHEVVTTVSGSKSFNI